jgi:PTS system mannose-specific IIA component
MTGLTEFKTGYLIIAHGALAFEMLHTLEFIAGKQPGFKAVAIDHAVDMDKAREIIIAAIDEIMTDKGVVALTDLFGGAPSNIAMSLMDEKKLEIVAGVNLPILIYAAMMDESLALKEKAQKLRDYGRNNIFVASEVLSGGK